MLIFSTVLLQNVIFIYIYKYIQMCFFHSQCDCTKTLISYTREPGRIKGSFLNSHPPCFLNLKPYWVHISTRPCWFFFRSLVDIPLNSLHFCSKVFVLISPSSLLAKITNTFYENVKEKRKKNIPHIWPVFWYLQLHQQTKRIIENSPSRQQECDNTSKSAKAGSWQLGLTLRMPHCARTSLK